MFKASLELIRKHVISITACACAAVVLVAASNANAANCSITTSPAPASITEGGSVTFNGSVSGKRPTAITSWDFPGGTPSSVSGDVSQVNVTYSSATGSPFLATMNGIDGKDGTCSAQVSVTVTPGGGGNCVRSAPTFAMGGDQIIAPDGWGASCALPRAHRVLITSSGRGPAALAVCRSSRRAGDR